MNTAATAPKYRKADWIAQDLRQQIVHGRYAPDSRLPTRLELRAHYQVSLGTIQKALQRLAHEGFVKANGTLGTTAATDSPHLTQYAMLMPFQADWVSRNQLMSALVCEARNFASDRQFVIHYGAEGSGSLTSHQQLIEDVNHRRLAGLIFAVAPFFLKNTPVVQQPGIPRVAIMTGGKSLPMPGVGHDHSGLVRLAASSIAKCGRRRPAMITSPHHFTSQRECWLHAIREAGLEASDTLLQQCPIDGREWLPNLLNLLFSLPADRRPDSLFISDDNLLEAAGNGLLRCGLRVPDDVLLVGACNFPWPTPCPVPVVRIGYSVPALLEACMRLIDAQRDGVARPASLSITPMTEAEYPGALHPPCHLGTRLGHMQAV